MPRIARESPAGMVFHVLNRGVGRMDLFEKPGDFEAFEKVLDETVERVPMRVLAWCVLNNHWHLLLWPHNDGDLGRFMQRLTITHVRRWVESRGKRGYGHIYQGRYKSFPVQDDGHLLTVARYVERNALRAGMVKRAENWRHGSLWRRCHGTAKHKALLHPWPIALPRNWAGRVNAAESEKELEAMRRCVSHGRPFGSRGWVERTVKRLGLPAAVRGPGRPKKAANLKKRTAK